MQGSGTELTGFSQALPTPDDKQPVSKSTIRALRSFFMLRLIDAMDMPSVSPNWARLSGIRQEFPSENPEALAR
jgi:hypothetical protein